MSAATKPLGDERPIMVKNFSMVSASKSNSLVLEEPTLVESFMRTSDQLDTFSRVIYDIIEINVHLRANNKALVDRLLTLGEAPEDIAKLLTDKD